MVPGSLQMPESSETRTNQGVSTSPLAPALEERNYHHNMENFYIIFCSKTISVVGPCSSTQPGSAEGWSRVEGVGSSPRTVRCHCHKPEFPIGKVRLSSSTNPRPVTSFIMKQALLSHLQQDVNSSCFRQLGLSL